MVDEIPAGTKAVYVFLEMVALRQRATRFGRTGAILGSIVGAIIITFLVSDGYRRLFPKPAVRLTPAAPTGLQVSVETELPAEESVHILSQATPCTLKNAKQVPTSAERVNPRLPAFVPEVKRLINKSKADYPNNIDILIELSLTNRGASSVVRNWRLCVVNDGRAVRFRPEEVIPDDDLKLYRNKVPMEEATIEHPIQTGHAVTGWLRFSLPKAYVMDTFEGGLEFSDYRGSRYSVLFISGAARQ